jgi:hypothetical protein
VPLGYVLYEGPSQLDGKTPIVVIATGFGSSTNRKTGDMIQTWIILQEEKPTDAIRNGTDAAICGDCVHRGDGQGSGRTCYVNAGQGPRAVYDAYRRSRYEHATDANGLLHDAAADVFRNQLIRFGAYGDPAAAPTWVWSQLGVLASGCTGYTHQWRTCDPALREWCMASVDSREEYTAAKALGWRTFRVRPWTAEDQFDNEVVCPASKEAGAKLTCASCLACNGTRRARRSDICISVHGPAPVLANHKRRFMDIGIAVVREQPQQLNS